MNEETHLPSFLDSPSESILCEYMLPFDKIKFYVYKISMTPIEIRVFIYLGKYGPKTEIEISGNLKITRTQTYRALNSLQNMGIVTLR